MFAVSMLDADVHGSSEVKTSEPWMKEVETSEPRMNEVETSEPRMNEVETSEPTMKEVIKNKAVYAGDATSDQPSKQLCPISIGTGYCLSCYFTLSLYIFV